MAFEIFLFNCFMLKPLKLSSNFFCFFSFISFFKIIPALSNILSLVKIGESNLSESAIASEVLASKFSYSFQVCDRVELRVACGPSSSCFHRLSTHHYCGERVRTTRNGGLDGTSAGVRVGGHASSPPPGISGRDRRFGRCG